MRYHYHDGDDGSRLYHQHDYTPDNHQHTTYGDFDDHWGHDEYYDRVDYGSAHPAVHRNESGVDGGYWGGVDPVGRSHVADSNSTD